MEPSPEARAALSAADVETLLTKFAALTHRIHGMTPVDGRIQDVRDQRDLIKQEIMRRTGDL